MGSASSQVPRTHALLIICLIAFSSALRSQPIRSAIAFDPRIPRGHATPAFLHADRGRLATAVQLDDHCRPGNGPPHRGLSRENPRLPSWGKEPVLISLYSGASCWLLLPGEQTPPAAAVDRHGPLVLESTLPANVVLVSVWRRMQSELHEHGYCCISEDFALLLLEEYLERYGTEAIAPSIAGGPAVSHPLA